MTKLKGGSNERPCQFVKRLEVIGKFVATHKLRKTGRGCERVRATVVRPAVHSIQIQEVDIGLHSNA